MTTKIWCVKTDKQVWVKWMISHFLIDLTFLPVFLPFILGLWEVNCENSLHKVIKQLYFDSNSNHVIVWIEKWHSHAASPCPLLDNFLMMVQLRISIIIGVWVVIKLIASGTLKEPCDIKWTYFQLHPKWEVSVKTISK